MLVTHRRLIGVAMVVVLLGACSDGTAAVGDRTCADYLEATSVEQEEMALYVWEGLGEIPGPHGTKLHALAYMTGRCGSGSDIEGDSDLTMEEIISRDRR